MTKAAKEPTKLQKDWIRVGAKEGGWRTWSVDEKTSFLLSAATDQENWRRWIQKDVLALISETLTKIAASLSEHERAINKIADAVCDNADSSVELAEAINELGHVVNTNAASAHDLTELLGLPTELHDLNDFVKPPRLDEDDENETR